MTPPAGNQHIYGGGRRDDEADTPDTPTSSAQQLVPQGTDDLLDEIDGLLEANAEEFVRSYVQKGGE